MTAATQFRIETASDAAGDGIATLIAAVFSEYEDCPFVESEFSELAAVSQYYHAVGGEIWIARGRTEHSVADPADNDHIVGCLAIIPTRQAGVFELFKMYVAREARGTGLAQQLYGEAVGWAAARGMTTMRLWTDTRFASGHRFYEKSGFAKQPLIRYLGDAADSWEYLFVSHIQASS
uniref:GNAT family N-acetyltransferase n=1 Tax=Pararhizobium sp. IMCC3301 TaxID=3067904 RepID=UPI0027403741|nr:GNAT family N-acetyltransferase [Pararhizobium sp. IMCC3301]